MSTDDTIKADFLARMTDSLHIARGGGATDEEAVAALRAAGLPVLLETPELRALLDAAVANHQHEAGRTALDLLIEGNPAPGIALLMASKAWAQQVKSESGAQAPKCADHERRMVDQVGEELAAPLID